MVVCLQRTKTPFLSQPRVPVSPWHRQSPPAAAASYPRQHGRGLAGVMVNVFALMPCSLAAGVTAGFLVKSRALTLQLGGRG